MKLPAVFLFLLCLFLTSCIEWRKDERWPILISTKKQKEQRIEFWADKDDDDFIALNDEDLATRFSEDKIPQPKIDPGSLGSPLPGIEGFTIPSGFEAAIFKHLHFNTDDYVLRNKEDLATLEGIAEYLNAHTNVYLFIEGHCDERGAEAYNLSLGMHRANTVRTQLVKYGIDSDRLHTVSYGKERPMVLGHNSTAWSKNRRAEFKMYKRF
jgi:peptidoglycan-associated lipoprotein